MNNDIHNEEVMNAINNMKYGKAGGLDGITSDIIKECPNHFIDMLSKLYNTCFTNGNFPDNWRVGIITPVYKKGPKNIPNNYRPITLLPILNKVFTKVLILSSHRLVD